VPEETRQLGEFIVGLATASIPASVRERLRYLTLDNLASGYIGSQQSCYRIAHTVMADLGGNGSSHVFGSSLGLDISRASLLNGVAIGAFETDHPNAGAHAGGAVFPAVLALGDSIGASGEVVMRALIAGYEVNSRIAVAQTNKAEQVRGFHNPGISGPLASAAACSLLLDLSLQQTLSALGIAASHSGGLIEYVWTGAMTKRLHLGRAAQMGLESALLARQGFTGPPTILEGEYGYLQAFSPQPITSSLVEDLGSRWLLEETRVKSFPGHGTAQPFAPVLAEWRSRGLDPRRIDSIEVTTSEQGTEERFGNSSPDSVLGAQYSLPFMTALAIVHGIDGLIELTEEVLSDELLQRVASRVTVAGDERFQGKGIEAGGEVAIVLDGHREVLPAPGLPSLSLQAMRVLCESKLERYAKGVVPPERIAEIEAIVEHFEEMTNVSELAKLVFG
jgi:2-methylcitrate dehydratase PrpD